MFKKLTKSVGETTNYLEQAFRRELNKCQGFPMDKHKTSKVRN